MDTRLDASRLWQDSPWGRLRHTVTEANLLRHLDPTPRRVLDVAGGSGQDAVRLAARGHEVTLLDPAGVMLRNAKEHAEAVDVADRLHVVQASAEDAPELFGPDDFDVVLCHNLLQYVEDTRAVLAAVTAPLRRDGVLSVLAPNPDAEPLRTAIHDLDPRRALFALGPTAGPAAETVGHLTELGFGLIVRYGVRCVCDYLAEDDAAHDPEFLADLERLELAMADRMPYLLTARYYHLIARR
ncbi:MAG TPA: methyltransferase domain-containing protein [Actinophytocola sp.]|uniref:methyltransferase domain-containing protein n=1 Tax=Actinophytocola sp. TaxID=1872138 RepID=UPI002DDD2875|nr:methyltransferase domain-containing protein [Actinophytocola sp.]HEV2781852.1 methyltransferase domain-containing protein [Actinophytocola sp.]